MNNSRNKTILRFLIPEILLILIAVLVMLGCAAEKKWAAGQAIEQSTGKTAEQAIEQSTEKTVEQALEQSTEKEAGQAIRQETGQRIGETVIIHTNDSHGRDLENKEAGIMGMSAVAALKDYYLKQGVSVIVLDAGDTFHGLSFATLYKGENVAKLMNLVGYDAMTPGNHDFNYGTGRLLKLAELTDFPLLSANVTVDTTGETLLPAMSVIERQGKRYGIFGLTTPEAAYKTNPENISGVTFEDPVKRAEFCVRILKEQNVDVIIGLMHMGTDPASDVTSAGIAKKVAGIDIIIDGHSHSTFENGIMEGDTLIASAGEYLKEIGVITVGKDGQKQAKLVKAEDFTQRDSKVTAEADRMNTVVQSLMEEQIGTAAVDLDGRRAVVRTRESNLGSWAADVIRKNTSADAVILTGGGIRTSIKKGDIKMGDVLDTFPFQNEIVIKQVTGKTLKEAVEHGIKDAPGESGAFMQVSGLWIVYDSSRAAGKRVERVCIGGSLQDGILTGAVEVRNNTIYKVAMTDHVAAGGDAYGMLRQAKVLSEEGSLEEHLIHEIRLSDTIEQACEGRLLDLNREEDRTVWEMRKKGVEQADTKGRELG